jgi:hypothetical protein
MGEAHLPHVMGMRPDVADSTICKLLASIEVYLEEQRALDGQIRDGIVREVRKAGQLDPTEKRTFVGKGTDAN